jgi:hypothetical protein
MGEMESLFFSGFCLKGEESLFSQFWSPEPFHWGGFSFGAQRVWEKLRNSSSSPFSLPRKVTLLSPAYFGSPSQKWIGINLTGFGRNKEKYIRNFLQKGGLSDWKYLDLSCTLSQLERGLKFNWLPPPREIDKIELHIYLGEKDPIIDVEGAYNFFKKYGIVYLIKGANHFLRKE